MRVLKLIISFLFTLTSVLAQTKSTDSIQFYLDSARQNSLDLSERLIFSEKASRLAHFTNNDAIILKADRYLSYMLYNNERYDDYLALNQQNLKIAVKLKDTLAEALITQNLADYYYENEVSDSCYYYSVKGIKLFKYLNRPVKEAQVLRNLADIQETERDYIGSEENAILAIRLLDGVPKTPVIYEELWILNNLLAFNAQNLNNLPKAIEYHQKALDVSPKSSYPYLNKHFSLNNMADVYRVMGEYDKSLELLNLLLEDKTIIQEDLPFYGMILNNVAYTKYLGGDFVPSEIENKFREAYHIYDNIENAKSLEKAGVTVDMAKYFYGTNQLDSAYKYTSIGMQLSKELQANDRLLETYKLMTFLLEGEESKEYFELFTKLNDSLINNERSARNKFARIAFETDQLKEEKEQANRERLIFLVSSIALLVTLILLYVIITQRAKNKALAFERQQQEANEEIYNLMLAQQDKIKEGRTAEKKRISEELHDGILSRLFGTRFSLDSLNMNKDDDAIKKREQYIQELQSIEQEIRKISHDLNADFIGDSSFSDILETLVETQCAVYNLSYSFNMEDSIDWDEVNNKTKIHIYRMLQETMQNVYKHAEASRIQISFELKKNVILLTVVDNGKGFNTNKARKGIGLKNFDSRARNIGGKFEIISAPEKGTKVLISIPTRD